jgi:thiol-disulfide isomerase/thioredoxin
MPLKPMVPAQLLMFAVVVGFAISIGACSSQRQTNSDTPVLSGPPSTTFPMPPLNAAAEMGWVLNDGSRARLGDYQGKVLVLDFYATWCEPCRKSIPQLIALQNRHDSKELQVVGLNVGGPDDRIKVAQFAKELGIEYPLGFPDKALTDLLLSGDQIIPQTFVFGPEGKALKRFIGYDQAIATEIEKMTDEAVNEKRKDGKELPAK